MNWEGRYSYNFPTSIRFGRGVIDELGSHLKAQGKTHPLIVTDLGLSKLPFFVSFIQNLKSQGLKPEVFTDIAKNPVKSNVLSGVEIFHKARSDSVVGLGGGASMDVARAIVLKAFHGLDLFAYDDALGGDKLVTGEVPYFVTVPTTSGTGSEVGRSTVISDDATHEKKILFSPKLMARQVFADPMLTMELPAFITAATGLDALTHNIEAYLSKGVHPICDGVALEGIRLIGQSLKTAVNKPDFESRAKMMMAALMGAVAFQKGLGVVHSTAHPLSTVFDLHHGLANAIMLSYGMEFNAEAVSPRIQTMAVTLGLRDAGGFVKYLRELNEQIGLPTRLGSQKITEKDVGRLADLAFKDPCHQCNPRPVTKEDFKEIYTKAL